MREAFPKVDDALQAEMIRIAKRLGGLSPDKRKAFQAALSQKGIDVWDLPIVPQVRQSEYLPLSFAQQRLWFLEQLEQDTPLYNLFFGIRFLGQLDNRVLEHSINELIRRHEILRTNIVNVDGEGYQVVQEFRPTALSVTDIRGSHAAPEALLNTMAREKALAPFNLAHDPLFRVEIIRCGDTDHVLMFAIHHLAFDAWSEGLITSELASLYMAFASGTPASLPELPIQYADFAIWQRKWMASEDFEIQRTYWERQLRDAPALLMLPLDHPRPAKQTFRGGNETLCFSPSLTQRIQLLCRQYHVTPYMLMLAAFGVVLARYSGQDDICIGTSIANRSRPETEQLVGFLVNTLVLRLRLEGNPPFREWLQRVGEVASSAYAHQDMPFEKLVELLGVQRNLAYSSLFQALFVMINVPDAEEFSLPGVKLEPFDFDMEVARFDLTLRISEPNETHAFQCDMEYNADLFLQSTIVRMLHHYQTLLESMVTNPEARLSELSMLSDAQRRQLLVEWNNPGKDDRREGCIHELFAAQVRRNPAADAVIHEGQRLSYQELDAKANRLAHYLRSRGVGPEVKVGLCLERSLDLIVGMLAILKAGGAYIPLDLKFPAERLAYMLSDSGTRIALTQARWSDTLSETGVEQVCLDRDWTMSAVYPDEAPVNAVRSGNLAYIIYTSGSTGRPKGVAIEHRQLINYVSGLLERLTLDKDSSLATVSTVAADLGNTAIFGALCSGRPLHVLSVDRGFDPNAVAEYMQEHRIDVLKIVPSHLAGLLEAARPEHVLPRRCLILGGEAVHQSLVARIRALAPDCDIINHYGPTETTVGVLTHRIEREADGHTTIPIGRPLQNSQAYILDKDCQLVPAGVLGEMYIGGSGLARGYLDRSDLTAERFVPDPFGDQPGGRLYRTGDRARHRPDGSIEFHGRVDNQVKVRGFRIELGEIEACLRSEAGITDAAVVVRKSSDGTPRLIAYVTAPAELDLALLRAQLALQLPDYMLPSAIVALETLPLTANGKVDHAVLPDPEQPNDAGMNQYVAPRTPIEETLANIWAEILHVERVGIHDNFFTLGGDSIKSLQVLARASRHGIKFTPKQLFDHQTIAALGVLWGDRLPDPEAPSPQPVLPREPFVLANLRQDQLAAVLEKYGADVVDLYPASPVQHGMVFHSLHSPASNPYFNQIVCAFTHELHLDAFKEAWQRVIERHAVLRTGFLWEGVTDCLQLVMGTATMPIEVRDWRNRSDQEREAALQEYLLHDRVLGFRFDQPPLMRVALMRLTDQMFWMVWSHHHALLDGWCQAVLVREILAFYQMASQGRSQTPDLAFPYRDYIAWLQQQDAAAAETFWRTYLKGMTAPTQLPHCTQSQPDGSSYGEHHAQLSSGVTQALTNLAQAERVTLNTIVQAAWGMALARFSGTDEVVFGITVAGRPHDLAGVESIMGVFINTLPLRVRVSPEIKLTDWLREIQSSNIELRQYEHTPLVQVQSWSGMDRRTPLFETIVVFQNYPLDDAVEDYEQSLGIDVVRAEGSTNYAITVDAIPGTQLRLTFSYEKQHIDDSTMHLMADHVVLLMEGMAAYPKARLADLPILTPAERTQLLIEWNATETTPLDDRCVAEIFEAQVEQTPDVIAVGYRDQRMSYRVLNHQANRIAHTLVAAGVGPETLVALLGERDSHLLTMILGIFKAGGAYLPLDPHHPVPRLSQILGLSRTPIVLTTTAYMERLQQSIEPLDAERRPRLIPLERILEEEGPGHNLHAMGRPDQLAYVIYTSGSTGVPKGAMITQRGLFNNIRSKLAGLALSNADVIAQTASQCFDISVWQLLTALLCGGRTQIVPDEIAHDPSRLLTHLSEAGITILEVVPAVLQGLVDAATAAGQTAPSLSKLRWLLPTGETLSPGLCRRWFTRYPGVPLMNAYGPAECSDDVAVHPILAPPAEGAIHIPIGRPIANLRLYLLNAVLAPVPVGVSGELYVGGIGVGRGYLQDSAKTAGAFLPDPFAKEPGVRLYKTGDLGRYRKDGTIEFLGRVDHQVKLRGFRIELGEIETRLLEHPLIQEVTVLLREDRPGERRLVAYVAGLAEAEWDPENLRRFLRAYLPDYMVPTVFVRLHALPRTPNGKIDRRALPIPELNDRDAQHDVLLRTPTEEILAGIWADVLDVERVGIYDNFFELGGHSLLATQVISRIRTAFQADLPLRQLFDFPTVKSLAEAVDTVCQKGAGRQVPPLVSVPRDGGLALSFAQQRLWFLAQLEPDSPIYNVPIALRLTGLLDIRVLQKSFQEVVRRHEVLRTTFVMVKDQPRQTIAPELALSVPVLDLTDLPHTEREVRIQHLATEEARRPFDLSTGPLLRVCLLRSGDQEHILLITLHHIASDGWSMDVLIQEMTTVYAAFADGQPSPLTPLPIQYADYAVWQRQWLQGEVLEEQLAYWRRQLKDVSVIALPTDRPRPAVQTYQGATHAVALSPVLTEQLNTMSRRHGVTLFMTLLAALKVLLKYETDQSDVVVGTDVANRHRVEIENLVGFFVNQLVLRTNVGDVLTFRGLLDRVREVTLAAHVHQDVPFEMLVATLPSKRDLRYPPLFQIKLILQNMSQQPVELPGLTLSAIDVEKATAELDVLVNLEETSEGLSGDFEYNTDLFDASSIARLAGHFTTILEQVATRSDVTLKELEHLLAGADSRQQSRKQQELTQASYTKLKSIKRKMVVHRHEK